MSEQESLAALLEASPPELRGVLTERVDGCSRCGKPESSWIHPDEPDGYGHRYWPNRGRVTLPVPEATLAAQEWLVGRGGSVFIGSKGTWVWSATTNWTQGPDIFAAIRAALEAK